MKKQNSSTKAQIIRSAFISLALVAVCAIPFALSSAIKVPRSHPAVPGPQDDTAFRENAHNNATSAAASAIRGERTLTFADRVAYQRAIEEVY